MRKFIINTIFFGCLAAILLGVYHLVLMYPQKKLMTLPKEYTTVYFGNSTVECAVNDSLIKSAYNFARSSETLDLVYCKLQLIKEYNPQVDTVVVGFDDIILFKDELNAELAHLYFTTGYSAEDWWMNLRKCSLDKNSASVSHIYHITRTRFMIEAYLRNIRLEQLGIGGYLRLHRDKLEIDIEQREKDKNDGKVSRERVLETFPAISRYYLDKIVEYCCDNNITLFFLNTPKHNYIWTDTIYRDIHRTYYPDVPLIDCMELTFPDSCYGDCVHLNYRGADSFSPMLPKLLLESK